MKRWPAYRSSPSLPARSREQGYLVVRYDKRGVGKSGGRDERATIEDYAGDALSIYTWLKKRKDVDKKRINIAGHSEGGAVAMIAGARQEDLAAMVLIAAPGTQGADLILEQQRHVLEVMNAGEEERKAKIDLQQKIQLAVMTGVGWDGIPEEMRKRADSPWFKSLLEFDPAKWMPRVKQPLLIIQGALDTQVPPHHADKLAALAGNARRSRRWRCCGFPRVNHLLVRAETGEVTEYGTLKEKTIVPAVAAKIAEFLRAQRFVASPRGLDSASAAFSSIVPDSLFASVRPQPVIETVPVAGAAAGFAGILMSITIRPSHARWTIR